MANLIGEALKAFDDRQIVLCVFLDLRKAFDTVSHHKVLTKLHQLGVKKHRAEMVHQLFGKP